MWWEMDPARRLDKHNSVVRPALPAGKGRCDGNLSK
jgi:hypothetical protein